MRSPLITAAALTLAAVVGCSSSGQRTAKSKAGVSQHASETPAAHAKSRDRQPAGADVSPSSPPLADKMAAYTRDMDAAMKARQNRKAPPASTAKQRNPDSADPSQATAKTTSDVEWVGEMKEPAVVTPETDPGLGAPLASNQVTQLTPPNTRSSDVPVIVPEGEDIPGQTGPAEAALGSDALLQQLAIKIRENPRDLSSQLDYQLLQFVRGARVPHMASIAGMTTEDREILTAMLDGLSNFRNGTKADANQMLSRKIRPLVEMSDRLRSQADLTLPNAALCTRVDGFGVYEPITPARFTGVKEHPFIIYCEVENFSSQLNEKKLWETRLSHQAVLYTETGLNVWSEKSDSIKDLSRNRRHDFFIVKKSKLPATLPIGRYVLKLSVTDQQSNRVAETTVPVQIVAQ